MDVSYVSQQPQLLPWVGKVWSVVVHLTPYTFIPFGRGTSWVCPGRSYAKLAILVLYSSTIWWPMSELKRSFRMRRWCFIVFHLYRFAAFLFASFFTMNKSIYIFIKSVIYNSATSILSTLLVSTAWKLLLTCVRLNHIDGKLVHACNIHTLFIFILILILFQWQTGNYHY